MYWTSVDNIEKCFQRADEMLSIYRHAACLFCGAAVAIILTQWTDYRLPRQRTSEQALAGRLTASCCRTAFNGSIVYSNLGSSFEYQSYIWVSIRQARLINPCTPIYLICSSNAMLEATAREEITSSRVQAVEYESLTNDLLDSFRQSFFVQGTMTPDGNTKFNQYTSERLLAVWALMGKLQLRDVIHLENDNLLYSSASDLVSAMQTCDVHLAIPFASVRIAVAGIAYIQAAEALEPFIKFAIRVFEMQPQQAVEYLETEWVNDMSLVGAFYRENVMSTRISEIPSKVYKNRGREQNASRHAQFLEPLPFRENHPYNCIAEALPSTIFDSCVLGQFFGGTFGEPGKQHWQEGRQYDPRGKHLWWRTTQLGNSQVRLPYLDNLRIHNLHVHSKLLQNFASLKFY